MNKDLEMSSDKNTEFKSELDDKNNTTVSHKKGRAYFLLTDEEYKKVFEELSDKYPKLFIKDRVLIMKKGIHRDIFDDSGLRFSKTMIRKFLQLYSEKMKYRELHIENTPRYDLEGKKVGAVTKEDVESLRRQQEEIKKVIAAKRGKQQKLKNNKGALENKGTHNSKESNTNPIKDRHNIVKKAVANQDNSGNIKSSNTTKPKLGLKL